MLKIKVKSEFSSKKKKMVLKMWNNWKVRVKLTYVCLRVNKIKL